MEVRSGTAVSGDVKLYYEDMGDPDHPPVLLIMGLGAQLLLWRTEFCQKLVSQGLRVIRYDNRDVGLSTKTDPYRGGQPLALRLGRSWLGLPSQAAYRLEDMADDAAALLEHLGIDRAHVVGASMGGMIAQVFAAQFAERTKSLGIIFSSNNRPFLPPPAPRALLSLIKGPSPSSPRDVIIDNAVRVSKIIGSPAYRTDEEELRAHAIEAYERSFHPWGIAQQFGAIMASGSLLRYNRRITAPTVVIHGRADKLMRPSGGRAIARAIESARLVLVDGMGHDLPRPLWDRVISELTVNFAETA
ncbi:alpha/beta hydrolase [Mycobacterium intermedium]|uniref:Alpha/beta hydrolase n=1 Tax=Mycobacterium intermedium TaxID=28445 RepID=A0A1E3SA06_MYCIE|nr:alpha/beta hydrolase [Mycobacterium intermedium]MCV6962447.1 alpha/beta hydrolase [Mycobacterium intermedium]ODQ98960.1 hydrolase [Mycobacterium intermedium]OPE51231.1 alpha/beta hydrolase [Mycobacterium intermedium]ORB04833.1 alpha/beta hydrolase [Mycobacterium intermedium]